MLSEKRPNMKRLLLVAGVVGVLMSVSSCKKEYDCNCTIFTKLNGTVTGTYETTSQITATKAEARKVCKELGDKMPSDPSGTVADMQCKLKN